MRVLLVLLLTACTGGDGSTVTSSVSTPGDSGITASGEDTGSGGSGGGTSSDTNVTVHRNTAQGTVVRGPGWYNRATDTELVNVVLSGNVVTASKDNRGAQLSVAGNEEPMLRYVAIEPGADAVWGMDDPSGSGGNLSVAPDYVDVSGADWRSWDLHLAEDSALVDAGDPELSDADGSVSDIGAYGGSYGTW